MLLLVLLQGMRNAVAPGGTPGGTTGDFFINATRSESYMLIQLSYGCVMTCQSCSLVWHLVCQQYNFLWHDLSSDVNGGLHC